MKKLPFNYYKTLIELKLKKGECVERPCVTADPLSLSGLCSAGLVLADDHVLDKVGKHFGHEARVHVHQLLEGAEDVLLRHQHEVEVVLQQGSHGPDDGFVLRGCVQHVDVELLGQVVDDGLRVGHHRAVVVGDPGAFAGRASELLEVWFRKKHYLRKVKRLFRMVNCTMIFCFIYR